MIPNDDGKGVGKTEQPSAAMRSIARRRRRRWRVALLGLAAVSLGLNWWGFRSGLPDIWHPDSSRYVAAPWLMSYRDLNPRISCNPPFFTFVMFAEREAIRLWFGLLGTSEGLLQFRDNAGLTAAGRLTSGFFAAVCVLLLFRLVATLAGRRAGVAAAALLAVNFLFVRNSHFALNDIPMTCCLLLAAERSAAYLRWGRLGSLWQGAAVAGLAFATKYTGGAALFFPLLGALVRGPARPLRLRLLIAAACGAIFAGAVLLANPFFLLDGQYYLRDFLSILGSDESFTRFSSGGVPTWQAFPGILRLSTGWIGSVIGVVGLILMACRRPRWAIVMATGPLVLAAAIVTRTVAYPRYVLPVVPFLIMGFAFALAYWRRFGPKWPRLALVLAIAALIEPAVKSFRFDTLCTREDTRLLARRWIEKHVPRSAVLVIDGNFPALPSHPYAIYVRESLHRYGPNMEPDYFVSDLYLRQTYLRMPELAQVFRPLYRAIDLATRDVAEFSPARQGIPIGLSPEEGVAPLMNLWKLERPGPPIRIHRLHAPRPRPLDVPVRRKPPLSLSDWRDILRESIFPEGMLLGAPVARRSRQPER